MHQLGQIEKMVSNIDYEEENAIMVEREVETPKVVMKDETKDMGEQIEYVDMGFVIEVELRAPKGDDEAVETKEKKHATASIPSQKKEEWKPHVPHISYNQMPKRLL